MRCFYCDYSPDTPSDFHRGLQRNYSTSQRTVRMDKGTSRPICESCRKEISYTIKADYYDDNEKEEFNAHSFSDIFHNRPISKG